MYRRMVSDFSEEVSCILLHPLDRASNLKLSYGGKNLTRILNKAKRIIEGDSVKVKALGRCIQESFSSLVIKELLVQKEFSCSNYSETSTKCLPEALKLWPKCRIYA